MEYFHISYRYPLYSELKNFFFETMFCDCFKYGDVFLSFSCPSSVCPYVLHIHVFILHESKLFLFHLKGHKDRWEGEGRNDGQKGIIIFSLLLLVEI